MEIELPWPENPANTCIRHTEPLDRCFDLTRSHRQYIPWPLPQEIEPATTEQKLYHWAIGPHNTQALPNWLVILGRRGPRGDRILCKEYGCNWPHTFWLTGRAIAMTSAVIDYAKFSKIQDDGTGITSTDWINDMSNDMHDFLANNC